jgi:hypothetical protein
MRKILTSGVLAAGLLFGLGSATGDGGAGNTLRLVYSTDLRGELHPCG